MAHQHSINKRSRPKASLSNCERDGKRTDLYFDVPQRFLQRLVSSLASMYFCDFMSQSLQRRGKQLMSRFRHLTSPKNLNTNELTVKMCTTELTQEG